MYTRKSLLPLLTTMLLLNTISVNCLASKFQSINTQQEKRTERLSEGSRLTPQNTTNNQNTSTYTPQPNTNQLSNQEKQTPDQRLQTLATNFITPINKLNSLIKNALKIDSDLNKSIQARRIKNRFASTKDLTDAAQTAKVTAYTTIFTTIGQLFAYSESLPTTTELQQSLYRDAAIKLGTAIQTLIQNICEQQKNSTKMNIKQAYLGSIQYTDFLAMIAKAAEFSPGFSMQQNNDIKRALTQLPQSKIPTITK
jgi:hypothetical protein